MRCSVEHLGQFVSCENLTPEEIGNKLTLAGLELDQIHPVAKEFSGVVIGEIIEAERHPNADKLQVCKIDVGARHAVPLQIVCGAKNARVGLKVAVALVGAKLPGDFEIKQAKLRGVESCGMLCSTSELGLTEESDGIWELPEEAPIGENLRDYFKLNDVSLEIELTPNRGDCASVLGLARELAALTNQKLKKPEIQQVEALSDRVLKIKIENTRDCPKYCGRIIENIRTDAKTPVWMAERLARAGQRCIHPVVDITNYVMLTLGQPMHGFDLDKIQGSLNIRRAKASEKLVLLDNQEINLIKNQLVIGDESGAIALAGIMGGLSTAVTAQTVNIFFESANFSINAIAGQARALGLNTDASYRFERGVDFSLPELALDMATQYLLEMAGGTPGPIISVGDKEALPVKQPVKLRLDRLERVLGLAVSESEAIEVIQKLGGQVKILSEGLVITAPSHRFDLNIEEDWIEEIARMIGLENLTPTLPLSSVKSNPTAENIRDAYGVKQYFVSRGYHEAITYSFISPKLHSWVKLGEGEVLKNPISEELSVMRTSLAPGLLQAAAHNLTRQASRVKLFEFGRVFIQQQEIEKIAGVWAGQQYDLNPHENNPVDFYSLKADLEVLIKAEWVRSTREFLHPGRSAELIQNGVSVGYMGQVHPRLQKNLEIRTPVYIFELDWSAVQKINIPFCKSISKFPSISRDIALVLDQVVEAGTVLNAAKKLAGEYLYQAFIFDIYEGDKIEPGKKSLALNLILQSLSHTLTDPEVQSVMNEIIDGLTQQFNAKLRE